jgi:hypothetical protein
MGVPRYPDEQALANLPANVTDLGSLVWIDNPSPGQKNLRVLTHVGWKGINIV